MIGIPSYKIDCSGTIRKTFQKINSKNICKKSTRNDNSKQHAENISKIDSINQFVTTWSRKIHSTNQLEKSIGKETETNYKKNANGIIKLVRQTNSNRNKSENMIEKIARQHMSQTQIEKRSSENNSNDAIRTNTYPPKNRKICRPINSNSQFGEQILKNMSKRISKNQFERQFEK